MNSIQARQKIEEIKRNLLELQETTSGAKWEENLKTENNELIRGLVFEGDEDLASSKIIEIWKNIQKNVPPGFSLDGNLVRHISFNELNDWFDVANHDVPRELVNIEEYIKFLGLIEYLESLHPEVARISEIVLNGDIDAALKTVYSSLDSKIRACLKPKRAESTVPAIGKAFKEGVFTFPQNGNPEDIRSFLQGVLGYFRSNIIHNPLPTHRNNIQASLSLFGIAHETYKLLDICIKR